MNRIDESKEFKFIIRNHAVDTILVNGKLSTAKQLKGSTIWDIYCNICSWLYYCSEYWDHKLSKKVKRYPYRLLPEDTEIDKDSYIEYKLLVQEVTKVKINEFTSRPPSLLTEGATTPFLLPLSPSQSLERKEFVQCSFL